jgi:flagellar biosynthesis/type III secretory pathway M-ring protein FliF/YscJ
MEIGGLLGPTECIIITGLVLLIAAAVFIRSVVKRSRAPGTAAADRMSKVNQPAHTPRQDIKAQMQHDRLTALLKMQQQYYQNLNQVEERAAQYGLNVPVEIANQIDYFKEKIAEVKAEIAVLGGVK